MEKVVIALEIDSDEFIAMRNALTILANKDSLSESNRKYVEKALIITDKIKYAMEQPNELLHVIRCSANLPSIVGTFIVPSDETNADRKKAVNKAEKLFKSTLASATAFDEDELQEALENGYGDEPDGDSVSLTWGSII